MNCVMRLIRILENPATEKLSIAQKQDIVFYLKRLANTSRELKKNVDENIKLKEIIENRKIKLK